MTGFGDWASQGALVIKNPPALQETSETQVQSLGGEDPLETGTATHSSVLAWRTPRMRGLAGRSPWGRTEWDAAEVPSTQRMAGGGENARREKQVYEAGGGSGRRAFVSTASNSISVCVTEMPSSGLDVIHLKSLWKIYMMASIR